MPHVNERSEDQLPQPKGPNGPKAGLPEGAAVPERDTDDVDPRLIERETEAGADEILADAGASHLEDFPDPAATSGRVDAEGATVGRDERPSVDDVTPT